MSSKDKVLISDMMESFVSEVPAKPFVTFCVVCNKGVISEDMMYEKGRVFHKDCYDKYGKNFPAINQDLLSQSTNAKVELVQVEQRDEFQKEDHHEEGKCHSLSATLKNL